MLGDENVSEEVEVAVTDHPVLVEPPLGEVEVEVVEIESVERGPRDPLSIALVAGLAALLLICVIFIFIANGHRPAGL